MDILFTTSNMHKAAEAGKILNDHRVERIDTDLTEPSVPDIKDIAQAKVEQAAEQVKQGEAVMIAEDSGLFVEALGGFPGPQTAFFDRTAGKERLLRLLEDTESHAAVFRAAVGYLLPGEQTPRVVTGEVLGKIVPARGNDGFGYDPYFEPAGHDKTFAQDPAYKEQVSHRRRALNALNTVLDECRD